ncbi:MAG: tRNA epoxyqueuosine(34) reductase QueG [Phycisphaerales bacterium]
MDERQDDGGVGVNTRQPGAASGGELASEIVAACRSLGFALAGITPALRTSRGQHLRDWLADGRHGDMAWLRETADIRADPELFLPGARSILIVADRYAPRHGARAAERADAPGGAAQGRIALYAQGLDYHAVMKKRLHALADALRARFPRHQYRAFVDSAPVLEREHAARAGLGFIGKHTLLINPSLGSYLLLGGIITTLALEGDSVARGLAGEPSASGVPATESCGSCTRCIDACPTGAITPYSVDARRCISYLTIEHAGAIEPEFQRAMGEWLFGCDVCQEVCPFNQERAGAANRTSGEAGPGAIHPAYSPRRRSLPVLDVLAWDQARFTSESAGTAFKRATLDMMKRNARLVQSNAGGDGAAGATGA